MLTRAEYVERMYANAGRRRQPPKPKIVHHGNMTLNAGATWTACGRFPLSNFFASVNRAEVTCGSCHRALNVLDTGSATRKGFRDAKRA